METIENRDSHTSTDLTPAEVNHVMRNRCATLGKTIYGEHTPVVFVIADCDDDGWWLDWHLMGVGGHYRLRFREGDIITMMLFGGTFQGSVSHTPDIIYDITVEAPENKNIPSNNDEDKQKAQAQQEETMEKERQYASESLCGKLVCIQWYAHNSFDGWVSEDCLRECTRPLTCLTLGKVVEENSIAIVLATTMTGIEGNQHFPKYGGVQVIVRNAIIAIQEINAESFKNWQEE